MLSELSSGPASPGTFWGGTSNRSSATTAAQVGVDNLTRSNSTGSTSSGATAATKVTTATKSAPGISTGAAAAAKAAITMKSSSETRKPAVLVKRQRGNSKASKITMAESDQTEASKKQSGRKVSPNEARHLISPPDHIDVGKGESDNRSVRSRRLSGASITTIEVPMPQVNSLSSGLSAACEMVLVPFEASRMWLRNHPRVGTSGSTVANRAMEMLLVILGTFEACWRVVFVYSKTGKLRLPKIERKSECGKSETPEVEAMTPAGFMWDCARSSVYVLIFLAMLVLVVRIIKWVLGVVRIIAMILRGVAWISRVLLGGGILW